MQFFAKMLFVIHVFPALVERKTVNVLNLGMACRHVFIGVNFKRSCDTAANALLCLTVLAARGSDSVPLYAAPGGNTLQS